MTAETSGGGDPRPTLAAWARAAADLFEGWGLTVKDWYLADESLLFLQGYEVRPEEGWERALEVHVDLDELPWEAAAEAPWPPPGHACRGAYEAVVEEGGVPLALVPFDRYSTPLTFRRPVDLDGKEVETASLKAFARRRTLDLLRQVERGEAATPAEAERWLGGLPRLEELAGLSWPRRDRWFEKFCRELAALQRRVADGEVLRVREVIHFGRRHVVV